MVFRNRPTDVVGRHFRALGASLRSLPTLEERSRPDPDLIHLRLARQDVDESLCLVLGSELLLGKVAPLSPLLKELLELAWLGFPRWQRKRCHP
jgi:hypothetical protein